MKNLCVVGNERADTNDVCVFTLAPLGKNIAQRDDDDAFRDGVGHSIKACS